jgi:hypothetical protein
VGLPLELAADPSVEPRVESVAAWEGVGFGEAPVDLPVGLPVELVSESTEAVGLSVELLAAWGARLVSDRVESVAVGRVEVRGEEELERQEAEPVY